MEKLIKPVDYAQELGISRQAVYAKIKRGILQSKSVDGKLYIAIDQSSNASQDEPAGAQDSQKSKKSKPLQKNSESEALLKAKDETIGVLKDTIKDLKKSNKQMTTTLRGEIDLLKEAFHEMRSMYVNQIEHIKESDFPSSKKAIEVTALEPEEQRWTSLKKFFKKHKVSKQKEQKIITKKLKKAYKKGDIRIISKGENMKLNISEDFEDILQ
jgi:predicted DNA-binding protein YlxM (UPF0122 family)